MPQVCLLDLEYNLPVQVRDQALGMTNDEEPQSDVGKEYQLHQRVKEGENGSSFMEAKPSDLLLRLQRTTPYYKVRARTHALRPMQGAHALLQAGGQHSSTHSCACGRCSAAPSMPSSPSARVLTSPLVPPALLQRNMARVCSFFAKGACNRGAECPYRHEMPTTGELADQNIKDRWRGAS